MGILNAILGFGKWIWRHTFGKQAYEEKIEREETENRRKEESIDLILRGEWEAAKEAYPDEISDVEMRGIYNDYIGW